MSFFSPCWKSQDFSFSMTTFEAFCFLLTGGKKLAQINAKNITVKKCRLFNIRYKIHVYKYSCNYEVTEMAANVPS